MYQYSIWHWLFAFYFYCFLGWCVESVYVSVRVGKWTNRGFIKGPFLPLYGCGAFMMLIVSRPFREDIFLTYIAGCIGATLLEYVTGVVMEALFQVRYWDYSNQKLNFQGHICLSSTLVWGIYTVLMTKVLHVQVEKLMFLITQKPLAVICVILTIIIGVDFALSFKAAIDLRNILIKMEQLKEEMGHIQKRLDVVIALVREDAREEMEELTARYAALTEVRDRAIGLKEFLHRRLIRSYPTMRSEKFKEALEELKRRTMDKRK